MEDSTKAQKSKEERDVRREEVLSFMKSLGPFSVPANVLAEKHNCSVNTIYSDRDFWIKQIKVKDISLVAKKLLMVYERNFAITEELKAKGTPRDRIAAIKVSIDQGKEFTDLLEKYGFKEKIADKMEHLGVSATFTLIEKSVEEIKNAKNAKTGSKSGSRTDNKPEASANPESFK